MNGKRRMGAKPMRSMLLPAYCVAIMGASPIVTHANDVPVAERNEPMVRQMQKPPSAKLRSLPEVADKLLTSEKSEWVTLERWIAEAAGVTKACKAKSFAFTRTSKGRKEDRDPVRQALYVCGPSDGKKMIYMLGTQKNLTVYLLNPDGTLRQARRRKTDKPGRVTIDPVPDAQAKSSLANEMPVFLEWVNAHREDLRKAGFLP